MRSILTQLLALFRRKPKPAPPAPVPLPAPPAPANPPPTPPPPITVSEGPSATVAPSGGDDAIEWSRALARIPATGGTLLVEPGSYRFDSELCLADRANLTIRFSPDAVINATGDGSGSQQDQWVFRLDGTIDGLTIFDARIVSAVRKRTAKQIAIGNYSGVIGRRLTYAGWVVDGVNVGISVNAHLGGSMDDVRVLGCRVDNALGTVSGSGYAFNAAGATNMLWMDNSARNAERHSFYQGWTHKDRVSNIRLVGNIALDHRKDVADGSMRCAFVVSRSHGVVLADNSCHEGYDGALEVSMVNTDPAPNANSDCYDILVKGFVGSGRRNVTPYLCIGEQAASTDYMLRNVLFENLSLHTDHGFSPVYGPDVWMLNGQDVEFRNPLIRHSNGDLRDTYKRAMTLGDARYSPTLASINNVRVANPTFALTGAPELFRPITLDGALRLPNATLVAPEPLFREG